MLSLPAGRRSTPMPPAALFALLVAAFATLAGCREGGAPPSPASAASSAPSADAAAAATGAPPTESPTATQATSADSAPPPNTKDADGKPAIREPIRAIYLSGYTAGTKNRWNELLTVADKTEINAFVIDVREDGMISYANDVPLARASGANKNFIVNVADKIADCKKRGVYTIARITVFRDKIVPRKRRDLAIQFPDGSPWRDRAGHHWLDPYNKANWDYAAAVAADAAERGFDEVQWDYVRFPSEGKRATRRYPAKAKDDTRSEARVIADFCKYAREKLAPTGVKVSADVFGLATSADDDLGIGQKLDLMTPHLDVVCPMVYPSHYGRGAYGIPHPNASPYKTVFIGLKAGMKRLKGTNCTMRPWLQDFSLGHVRYGEKQVRDQIRAARENGVKEYLLWNASNRYTTAALVPPKPKKTRQARRRSPPTTKAATRTETRLATPRPVSR